MKKKILQFIALLFMSATGVHAQTSCADLNGYVSYKNTADTGFYTLNAGYEEKAAQTYHYSGPGKISSVRVYGHYPTLLNIGGVPLRVGIYNVDNTGRPTSLIQLVPTTWWWFHNNTGFIDVYLGGGGVTVNGDFAVEVELRTASPWGSSFRLQYTGNGEGNGENLASLAGTSTGGNWSSAMTDFSRDGDFYLVPRMTNYITSNFIVNSICIATGGTVNFINTSTLSRDSMFNRLAMSNGSGQYFDWNFGDGSGVSHSTNPNHTYSTPGVYTISLTTNLEGWAGNCTDVKTMQISVGLAVASSSVVNATCNGSSNGSVVATGSGGASPYTYSVDGESYSASPNFTGLSAGSYTLYVTDNLGCTASSNFTITQPTAITFTTTQTTNSSCGNADGGILVTATGGAGALQYRLNSGNYQSTGIFSNKGSGSYTVTVKDANNCTASVLMTISDAGGPTLSVLSMTNASCSYASDGSIVLNGSGGSGVLQYSINGGSTFQTSGSFLNLPGGAYPAMVKDASGCSKSTVINIMQPQALSVFASAISVNCNGGSNGQVIVTAASGGTGSFTYSIDGVVYQSSPVFPGLMAGNYIVRVKDVAQCIGADTLTVHQPTAISATATTVATTCHDGNDGTITLTASGGEGNYSYGLSGINFQSSGTFTELSAGTYVVAVKDKNNCLLNVTATVSEPTAVTATINVTTSTCGNSNGGFLAIASGGSGSGYLYSINSSIYNSTGLFNALGAGTYYVIVADGAGCGNIFSANITDANGPVIGSSSHTNVACNDGSDGSITVSNITGGTGNLEYSLNGTDWQSSPVFTGLNAGTFNVTVKDANGCTGTISETLTQPSGFVMTTSVENLRCYGDHSGVATVFASGGSGIFAYSLGGVTFQSSSTFSGLGANVHMIVVRDAAGCFGYTFFQITQPSQITVQHGELNVSCHGDANGTIALFSAGGTGSYNYSLTGSTYQTSNLFTGLSGGNYTGYVRDSSGCVQSAQIHVIEPAPLTVVATTNNVSCAGGNNGIITLDVSGGTEPYNYYWSNEATIQYLFNLTAGTYSVRVEDNNGCAYISSYSITQPSSPLIVNGVVTNAATTTSNDGSVGITVTGGNTPYTFAWSNGATSRDISGLAPGSYTVNITDANGCITTGIFLVSNATGISEVDNTSGWVTLYPNPSTDIATVEVNRYSISNLKIMNMNGDVVSESEPNRMKVEIRSDEMASGIYFVKLLVNGNTITKKLIVTK